MEKVFKEGMKVYDSFNFPGEEGVIKTIEKNEYRGNYPIIVTFKRNNGNSDIESYTIEGCYRKDSSGKLAHAVVLK